jgi:hypothetical protein
VGRFELLVLLAFAAMSMWTVALDVHRAAVHGLVWTGTDGYYIVDQMQYLAWVQDAAHHFLVSNLFVLRATPNDYFQPAVIISGALVALGVPAWLALLLWKPVAVVVLFFAVRAYIQRSLDGTWQRRAGLVLGLFFGSYTLIYGNWGVIGDLFSPWLSWGYTFGLVALGAMVFAFVAYDRARRSGLGIRERAAWAPAVLGALASLLHPWQGELLILVVVFAELALWQWDRHAPRRIALPALTVVGTGIPLLYYAVLARTDMSWRLARVESKHTFSLMSILLGVTPLLLPALLAWRPRRGSFIAVATRMWPLGALAIYVLSRSDVSATPLHAFDGISIPLAVLAIEGVRRVGVHRLRVAPALATLAVAALTIPPTLFFLKQARQAVAPAPGNANFITHDENRALKYLAKYPASGGVLTRFYLGEAVPGATGRQTFVGHCLWSEPRCMPRAQAVQNFFDGVMSTSAARTFVRQTGARFVLADCKTRTDVRKLIAPITQSVHPFGCATVYVLGAPQPPTGPLAESSLHAALRASGRQQRRVQSS